MYEKSKNLNYKSEQKITQQSNNKITNKYICEKSKNVNYMSNKTLPSVNDFDAGFISWLGPIVGNQTLYFTKTQTTCHASNPKQSKT